MQSSLFLSLLLLLLCTSALAVPVVTKPEADKVEPHDEETSKDTVVEPVVEHDEDVEEDDAKDATGMKIDDDEDDEEELHEGEGDIVMKDGGSVDAEDKEAEKETEGEEEVDQDAVDADDDDVIETTEVPISTLTTESEDSDGASEVSSILKEAESTSKLVDGASTEASTELPSTSSSSTPSTDEEESTTVEPEEHFNETSTTEAPTTTTTSSSESKKEGEEEIVATSTVEVVHKQTQFTEGDIGAAKLLEVVAEKLKAEPNGEEPDKIVISEQKLHKSIAKIIE